MSSVSGKFSTIEFVKAIGVLDMLGSSMTNLNNSMANGKTIKGKKISILSFEVASTIVKGANLMQSLSKKNFRHLKKVVLPSEGVQNLISSSKDELLRIVAADKREELKIFSKEVVRFGNHCNDPQWRNLDRYFERLSSELTPQKHLKGEAKAAMEDLMILVQHTAELYHEFLALGRFQKDYNRMLQEDDKSHPAQRRDNLAIFRKDIKTQRKHVESLKKKSLWSKTLEEVVEKLVDTVRFLHLEIHEAFVSADGDIPLEGSLNNHKRLGTVGLALHYAIIIEQIDTLVSQSSYVPLKARDALYERLPHSMKSAFRSMVQSFLVQEEFSVVKIRAEMEKTLQWLVPMATSTTKAHRGFRWVREWANMGSKVIWKPTRQTDALRIKTLHHAYKEKTEAYILELIVWLHHLFSQGRPDISLRYQIQPHNQTIQSYMQNPSSSPAMLTAEDQEMLRGVKRWRKIPGISKSQNFDARNIRLCKQDRLSKSWRYSPLSEREQDAFPIFEFDTDWIKALDVIDRVDTIQGS